jgi:acetylornithine deacetylase/succinyl-diaminopimelate desuccinylase-like protein
MNGMKVWPGLPRYLSQLIKFYDGLKPIGESFNLGILRMDEKKIELILDHRTSPRWDPQTSFKKWNQFLRRAMKDGLGTFQLSIEKDNPHWYGGRSGKWLKGVQALLRKMNRDSAPVMKLGCTEAGFFSKKGCEVVTFGPGRAHGNAHQPNESVPIGQLVDSVRFYRKLIQQVCT